MNKKLKVLPVLAMGLMLVACNGTGTSSSKPATNDEVNFTLKVGSYATLDTSKNQVVVSSAAVILKDDKIADAYFDVMQAPFKVDNGTTVVIDTSKTQTKDAGDKVVETKQELKKRYAMHEDDESKEWYNQAASFAKYTVGKTIDEVTSKNYKDPHSGSGTDEVPGCTISLTNFTTALKVITDTKTFKAPANTASVGLGYKATALDDDKVFTVTIAGTATDKSGKVLETSINAYQVPLMVSTTDATKIAYNPTNAKYNAPYAQLNAVNFKDHTTASADNKYYTEVLSKRELKELYGMKSSATQGEWFTQADSFARYAKGKVASTLTDKNYKSHYNKNGTEVVAGCSISMGDFATAISKSATNKSGLTAK